MAKKSPARYPCPHCGNQFTTASVKKYESRCPSCKLPVKMTRQALGYKKGFKIVYERDEVYTQPDEARDVAIAPDIIINGTLVSPPDTSPIIYLTSEEQVDEDGKVIKSPEYFIHYENVIYSGPVHCPRCGLKMFENRQVHSPHFHQSHMCRKNTCRALVTVRCTHQEMSMSRFA